MLDIIEKKILEYCSRDLTGHNRDILAKYPSNEWSMTSWSWLLLQDLKSWESACNALKKRPVNFIEKWVLLKTIFIDNYSYHYDASKKVYLYKKLNILDKNKKILIPEVGMCGFDLIPVVLAGFNEIVVYDIDDESIELCKDIWSGYDISFEVLDSKEINIEQYKEFHVVIPDWSHESLEEKIKTNIKSCVEYSMKGNRRGHLNYLDYNDFISFFSKVKEMKWHV